MRIDGHKTYLGGANSQESRGAYDRVIGEIARGRTSPALTQPQPDGDGGLNVNQVLAAFWAHAETAYPCGPYKEGKRPPGELGNFWDAIKPLRRLYGPTSALKFGPKSLKAVREEMVKLGWCRNVINWHVARLKHVFKWAAENELVQGEVYFRVAADAGLRRGCPGVKDTAPVRPVPQELIAAVRAHLTPTVRAMVDLQLLTGARPGEIRTMKTCEIDTSTPVWHYRPSSHKTAHHGIERDIRLGKQAQGILKPLLRPDLQAFVFSPADAEAERLAARREARKSPMTPSQARRAELAAKRQRRRPPKDPYTKDSYRRAVVRACCKAFDPKGERQQAGEETQRFAPNPLRHNAATLVRKLFGLDAAKALPGHRTTRTTEVYAEIDDGTLEKVVSEVG